MLGQRSSSQPLDNSNWDVVVIGGGITGAGIFLEAAKRGLKVLLVEQQDFSWGTSSRSSKMVHGGLRYIAQGDIRLTQHSLQERERLLIELPDLVVRMPYIFPIRKHRFPNRWAMHVVLYAYDWLAGIRDHHWLNLNKTRQRYPYLNKTQLKGAMSYTDALTDDSRLVMRVLQEGCLEGGVAHNYCKVTAIKSNLPDSSGVTVDLLDQTTNLPVSLNTRHIFNATGLWADRLSGSTPKVRPQRGSHIFVPKARLPITDCFTVLHPEDKRPVFVYPWKGETCIGTTDLDHRFDIDEEAFCSTQEVAYLLNVVNHEFNGVNLEPSDIISTMAGVRPIIASQDSRNPSKERRDHLVWQANGVVSVSGGKLTTFRQIALDALKFAGIIDEKAHHQTLHNKKQRCFTHQVAAPAKLDHPLAAVAQGNELQEQIQWILNHEMVVHLDDLMLRRLRAGNMLANEQSVLDIAKPLCMARLGWDESVWQQELIRYQGIRQQFYQAN